tara:strand:- start:852 stop:1202 length:351 start_codon:yes stop_codon:yes gene_type:complete
MSQNWIPEIMYEETDDGLSSHIPFIMVPSTEKMPKMLFIFESRDTGEHEPNTEGDPVPIFEMDLHQYADMQILKEGLQPEVYDVVRKCLGLEPLREAATKGAKITESVRKNLDKSS